MEKSYIHSIVEYFYDLPYEKLDEATIHQVARTFLDYTGCTVYSIYHNCCRKLVDFFSDICCADGQSPWGIEKNTNCAGAAAANASRTSSLELDDVSGINASVHAGVYVWTAALEAWKKHQCSMQDFIKAIVFGYDICMRVGMLSGESVREFGFHGPGMCGGMAAAATASMILGLSAQETENAICITGSILPLCPFISFIEGADSKDMYGGWGMYQAFFAIAAAKQGITGPKELFESKYGLKPFYCLEKGRDIPFGTEYFINSISFKEFSACFSVHPAVTCVLNLLEKHEIPVDEIASVEVETYPYSYALSMGSCSDSLTGSSARLSVPYCVAFSLIHGDLPPKAFTEESLSDARCLELASRITLKNHIAYGEGPYGIRGSIVRVQMKNGAVFETETKASRWNGVVSDAQLTGKFLMLTQDAFSKEQQETLRSAIFNFNEADCMQKIISLLHCIKPKTEEATE